MSWWSSGQLPVCSVTCSAFIFVFFNVDVLCISKDSIENKTRKKQKIIFFFFGTIIYFFFSHFFA